MLGKSLSVEALGTADLPSLGLSLHPAGADSLFPCAAHRPQSLPPRGALQLVLSLPLALHSLAQGLKQCLPVSCEALSQNKIKKQCWPQSVPVSSLHATLPDALKELGMSYLLPSRM